MATQEPSWTAARGTGGPAEAEPGSPPVQDPGEPAPQDPPQDSTVQEPAQDDPGQEPQQPQGEESEVLETRRRGAEEEEPTPAEEAESQQRWGRFYWDYGPRFDGFYGDLSIVVGGRLHLDVARFSDDAEIIAAFGEPEEGVSVRRAFIETGGVYKDLDFNLWLNFSDVDLEKLVDLDFDGEFTSSVDFRNVFVGLNNVPVVGGIRVGYFKEPFGLEEITSSNDITFMERSLTDTFIERRNLGVQLHRRFTGERRMTAAVGFFQEMDNDLDTMDGYGVTGRVTGAPILSEDGRSVLHLGASATYRWPSDDLLQFFSRPESAQAQVMVDTGLFPAERDIRAGLELGAVNGSVSLQSEVIVAAADGINGSPSPFFPSVYVMGSWVFTGEHRNYRPRVGAFGTVIPFRSFPEFGSGAWELRGRYSYVNLDSDGINGGALQDWTLGVNWYMNQQARMMFEYIAAHPSGFDFQHIFQLRLQLNF